MTLISRSLDGRYRLDAVLGVGGMATVYRAWDLSLERPVAVKILAPNLAADATFAARFGREARAMARVQDPAVVAVFDVGESNGQPYIVMELVEGESLAELLGRERVLAPDVLAPIVSSVASALGALHGLGLIHRDVKPHNILLPSSGQAKLADFGLVGGDATSSITLAGTAFGTLGYLAPELLRGGSATTASDVYAVGVVAYEALTGARPSVAPGAVDRPWPADGPPVPPSALAPWLGDAFDRPLLAALGPAVSRPDIAALAGALRTAAATWRPLGDMIPPRVDRTTPASEAQTEVVPAATAFGTTRAPRSIPRALAAIAVIGAVALVAIAGILASSWWPPLGVQPTALPARASQVTGPPSAAIATPHPSKATPSATIVPKPTAAPASGIRAALASVDAYEQTVSSLAGGASGIKGKDTKMLTDLAGRVRSALQAGDLSKARDAARRLVDDSNQVARHLEADGASRLVSAAQSVQRAVAGA